MYRQFTFAEVTKDNENKYLDGIVELENSVYANMIRQGKVGQLFTTGRDDISEYIKSENNSVFVAVKNDEVLAAAYITQGQIPFTYNDVTKYYKCSDEYDSWVESQYANKEDYLADLRKVYIQKIAAFMYARDYILRRHFGNLFDLSEEEKNMEFMSLIDNELNDSENRFHEKSVIRDDLNKYMSLYMLNVYRNARSYERFYWADMEFIAKKSEIDSHQVKMFGDSKFDSTIKTYDSILELQKYHLREKSAGLQEEEYFEANTDNTIEIDTYITSDKVRELGLARIIVFEGIKKVLERQNMRGQKGPIFLVSTLHRDNLSSKYVSEFFGLKDNIFVQRRTGRQREVHICRVGMIERSEIDKYLQEIEKKLIVLYKYNPGRKKVGAYDRRRILLAQISYEKQELNRLEKHKQRYNGYIRMKKDKIKKLEAEIVKLAPEIVGLDGEKDIDD